MSDDLVRRLNARIGPSRTVTVSPGLYEDIRDAATTLTEARAEIERRDAQIDEALRSCLAEREGRLKAESELATLRDMLVLCGELGGMGKDEAPADYLRRLIDEVAGVESIRARVREVVGPFGNLAQRYDDTVSDGWIPWTEFITDHEWPTEPDCRAARQLMEDLK